VNFALLFSLLKRLPTGAKILVATMTFTVISFFVQSALPPKVSAEESEAVAGFLSKIISDETVFGRFIIDNIRKIGHFLEYGLLGMQSALFAFLYVERRNMVKHLFFSTLLSLVIALFDETTQIFSGRGPSITDVWIDFFGYTTLLSISFTVLCLCAKTVKIFKEKNNG
jgi:VanZ family protein